MSILAVAQQIITAKQIARDALVSDAGIRAAQVKLYREYYDGDHPITLTAEMRAALRAKKGRDRFNANHMPMIVTSMVSRTNVASIVANEESADTWASELMELNKFDALSYSVHEATCRDADSFVMITYDENTKRAKLTHELAYDGVSGIIPFYRSYDKPEMVCAAKFWHILTEDKSSGMAVMTDKVRMNLYFADRLEKWVSIDGSKFVPFAEKNDPDGELTNVWNWTDEFGQPLGIPIVHFKNRPFKNFGISELEAAIPVQDAMNRLFYSLIIASELAGFDVRYLIGAPLASQGIMPGAFLVIKPNGVDKEQQMPTVGTLVAGKLTEILAARRDLLQDLSRITMTPIPELMGGDSASGEALKTRESQLLAKIAAFKLSTGVAWESVLDMAWRVEAAFGTTPPDYQRFYTRWLPSETRVDKDVIANAVAVKNTGAISDKAFLEIISPIFGWDATKIDAILKEAATEKKERAAQLAAQIPGNSDFSDDFGDTGDDPPAPATTKE